MNQTERIAEYYNHIADIYEEKHGVSLYGQSYNFENYYRPFLEKTLPAAGRILELGSGTGVYTEWLSERGFAVVGMDISSRMLEKARLRCPQAIFLEGDCENPALSLSPSMIGKGFDAIVGINALSYVSHKEKAVLHYAQLLRPQGRLVVIDMNGACPFYTWMAWMNKNEMRHWLAQIKESNRSYLTSLLESAGFQIKKFKHFTFIPNGLGKTSVHLLRPINEALSLVPGMKKFAMRIAFAAIKG